MNSWEGGLTLYGTLLAFKIEAGTSERKIVEEVKCHFLLKFLAWKNHAFFKLCSPDLLVNCYVT